MKTLRIIVPKDSAVDSYLADVGFIYTEIERTPLITCYKMNISKSFKLIDLLVSIFCLKDYFIWCFDGVVTFYVRS